MGCPPENLQMASGFLRNTETDHLKKQQLTLVQSDSIEVRMALLFKLVDD